MMKISNQFLVVTYTYIIGIVLSSGGNGGVVFKASLFRSFFCFLLSIIFFELYNCIKWIDPFLDSLISTRNFLFFLNHFYYDLFTCNIYRLDDDDDDDDMKTLKKEEEKKYNIDRCFFCCCCYYDYVTMTTMIIINPIKFYYSTFSQINMVIFNNKKQ